MPLTALYKISYAQISVQWIVAHKMDRDAVQFSVVLAAYSEP